MLETILTKLADRDLRPCKQLLRDIEKYGLFE
jgi:hypothetical protein